QKAQRIIACLRARFVGGDDVVGDGCDVRRVLRLGTERTERIQLRHEPFIIAVRWRPNQRLAVRATAGVVPVAGGRPRRDSARSRGSGNAAIGAAGTGSPGGIARCAVTGLMYVPFFLSL